MAEGVANGYAAAGGAKPPLELGVRLRLSVIEERAPVGFAAAAAASNGRSPAVSRARAVGVTACPSRTRKPP